jgi:hypothetical protein
MTHTRCCSLEGLSCTYELQGCSGHVFCEHRVPPPEAPTPDSWVMYCTATAVPVSSQLTQ